MIFLSVLYRIWMINVGAKILHDAHNCIIVQYGKIIVFWNLCSECTAFFLEHKYLLFFTHIFKTSILHMLSCQNFMEIISLLQLKHKMESASLIDWTQPVTVTQIDFIYSYLFNSFFQLFQ